MLPERQGLAAEGAGHGVEVRADEGLAFAGDRIELGAAGVVLLELGEPAEGEPPLPHLLRRVADDPGVIGVPGVLEPVEHAPDHGRVLRSEHTVEEQVCAADLDIVAHGTETAIEISGPAEAVEA
jgi:hypothetical protein